MMTGWLCPNCGKGLREMRGPNGVDPSEVWCLNGHVWGITHDTDPEQPFRVTLRGEWDPKANDRKGRKRNKT